MENLDKETQIIAVEKVLEEMQRIEEFVTCWKAVWWEQCLDAYCKDLYHTGPAVVQDLERKYHDYYKLSNVYNLKLRIGEPLRKVVLEDNDGKKYKCEFGRIDWTGMNSQKSKRFFSFKNNGEIYFSKDAKRALTKQHPKHTSYDATFNVLSNDFNINFTLEEFISRHDWNKTDFVSITLCQNILTKKFNDIEIMEDLNTGMKLVKIVKKYDKHNKKNNASITFEATLNPDDSLKVGAIVINTHRKNGKVNGTYRFDASRKKGIRANFYSRKGVKIDLATNPMLLGTANNLLLPAPNNQTSGNVIVSNFANSTQNAIAKKLSQRVISFDSFDFNMETVKQTDLMVIEMVKNIKGELPIPGLVERIDNCLELINKQHNLEIDDTSKTLKLKTKN